MIKKNSSQPKQPLLNLESITKLSLLFLSWRVGLFVLSAVAGWLLPYRPSFPYAEAILLNRGLPQWLASWANFDGVHYLTIVEKGYFGTGLIQAFFPFYPALIWLLATVRLDALVAGVTLSNLFFVGLLLTFFAYIRANFSSQQAWWSVIVLALFPTSFFFGAVYTESLFLLLVLGSLWAGQQKQWLLASLLVVAASATRLVGVFLVPALLLELLQSYIQTLSPHFKLNTLLKRTFWQTFIGQEKKAIALVLAGSGGLLCYMVYLRQTFNDPLYFYHVQSEFGSGRQESIVLLPQVFWRYFKILLTYRPIDLKYFAFVQELVATILGYLVVLLASRKVRWSLTLFSLLALTLPTLTGTLSSMPRYLLVALPIYLYLGHQLSDGESWWKLWLVGSTLLLVMNTILFIQGYWVA